MSHGLDFVTLPLTTTKAGLVLVPQRSGLNWGQRYGRQIDQAYLSVPADIQRAGFFPERGEPFAVECDDGFLMKCVRAQQNGKAIQTPSDNGIIGRYFRDRLGVRHGHMVTVDHLYAYGRLSVDVYFRDQYRYYLDFSVLGSV